jgi:dihydrolipoamide dehydrogenase
MSNRFDLIVIGGGPAGYVAAIRAAQLGMKTVVFEKESLGGTCLNVGCIPTKALFQSAEIVDSIKESKRYGIDSSFSGIDFPAIIARKDRVVKQLVGGVNYLMKKNNIVLVKAAARFESAHKIIDENTKTIYEADNIVIATGSVNAAPPIPGIDGRNVLDSTKILALDKVPKSLAVIGGGVIGCEFANIFASFGCKVTAIEMLPGILANLDESLGKFVETTFTEKGIEVITGAKVQTIKDSETDKIIACEKEGKKIAVNVEYVLVSTGRKAATESLNLNAAGVTTERGFITVDDQMRTNVQGVYAAGDVTGRSLLAHAAYEEGTVAVENINNANKSMRFNGIPSAVFVGTEISSVGLSEKEAKAAGYDVVTGKFSLAANGRAIAMGNEQGFVKVVSEGKNHEILGIHIAGPSASELVTIGASLISMEAVLEDVADTIYPHPSVSEAIREACLDALGCPLHG